MKIFFIIFVIFSSALLVKSSYSIERFDQYPVKSYTEIQCTDFNELIISSSKKGEKWVSNPLLIAIKYLENPNYRFTSILRADDSAENATESIITIVLEGYLDDDLRGNWFEMHFKNSETQDYWLIKEIRKANLRRRWNAPEEFNKN